MTTILEVFGLRDVKPFNSKHGEHKDVPLPNQIVGLELEIENWEPVDTDGRSHTFGGFTFVEDGSLRNSGIEAISKPVAVKHVEDLLTAFFDHFKINVFNYSERCSTHVHFNILPLTIEQVSTICLVYQTVERLLFEFVGNDRDDNIFCHPWYQCGMNYNIVHRMTNEGPDMVFRRWQKYTAMNLIPAATQGTMEFRHLHGTCEVRTIMDWIKLISSIFAYAQNNTLDACKAQIVNMNTVSNYREWMDSVFGKYSELLKFPGFEKEISVGVIDSKLMLAKPNFLTLNRTATGRHYIQNIPNYEAFTIAPATAEDQASISTFNYYQTNTFTTETI